MANKWQTLDPSRVTTGPVKILSFQVMEWGYEMTEMLQVPVDTKVLNVRWAKPNGTVYRPGLVVCVRVHCEMPAFQRIHHVVVKDGKLLLVTFALQTICLDVVCTRVGAHVAFCHKAFDIQTSYISVNSNLFIPYHFLCNVKVH